MPSKGKSSISRELPHDKVTGLSEPALRSFFRIANLWSLDPDEQMKVLGISCRATLVRWRQGDHAGFNANTLERASLVFGIFKAINILLSDPARADAWMRAPNTAPLFGGKSALALMSAGDLASLQALRTYLDAELNA